MMTHRLKTAETTDRLIVSLLGRHHGNDIDWLLSFTIKTKGDLNRNCLTNA